MGNLFAITFILKGKAQTWNKGNTFLRTVGHNSFNQPASRLPTPKPPYLKEFDISHINYIEYFEEN
jgi:hypothetical protein